MEENRFEITHSVSAEEYMDLRGSVGWRPFALEQAAASMNGSAFICCIRDNGRPVGFGRLIWDGGYIVYVSDIIVRPEYQGQGLGRKVMETLMAKIETWRKPGYKFMLNLMSARGKEDFYEKFGFLVRPNETEGKGMYQWLYD